MLIRDLTDKLGADRVFVDTDTRRSLRRDAWVLSELDDVEEVAMPLPVCVVRPASRQDVVTVVDLCRATRTPLIPAGLRSGVCGAVRATQSSVVLDMSALASIRSIDPHDLIGSFDCGVRGSDAEARLSEQGLTLGHFPQSIALSSIGGWVATRAAGQFSTGYGNIEDLVLGLEAVLPDGSIFESGDAPRAAVGPDLRHLLLGSEGTLGVVTRVNLALRRQPEARSLAAYYATSMQCGLDAQREMLQAGWTPAALRLYDAREVARLFGEFREDDDCLLLVVHEGPRQRVAVEQQLTAEIAGRAGCRVAPSQATQRWLESRNRVPTFRSFLEQGVVVDTIEVAAPYSRIAALYAAAIRNLEQVAGVVHASGHSSHAYRSGINLYLSFAAKAVAGKTLRSLYHECWTAVMEATLSAAGTISHHHGVGRVRREWIARDLGPGWLGALKSVKQALDPAGFMNPGVLLPD